MNVFDAIYLNESDPIERSFIAAETALDIAVARATKEYTLESGLIELSDDKLFIESEGSVADSKKENSFIKAVKAICNAIRNFIGDLFKSIIGIFDGRENITAEDYLESTTGKIRLEKDTRELEKVVDAEIRKGNKLLQWVSSKTGISDEVIDEWMRSSAEKIQKIAPVVITTALGFGFKKIFSKMRDKKKHVDEAEKTATTGDNTDSKKNKQKLKIFGHMKTLFGHIGKNAIEWRKQMEANKKKKNTNTKSTTSDARAKHYANEDEFTGESVSLFGIDINSDNVFIESESIDMDSKDEIIDKED